MSDITRRRFGVLSVGFAGALAAGRAWAQSEGYANPHLLIDAIDLVPMASAIAAGRSHQEASDTILVDVRSIEEFNAGHIPGARHLDPNAMVAEHSPISGDLRPLDEISALLSDLGVSPQTQVILYDDRGGFHAARMFWLLEYFGHRNAALLNGGLTAWVAGGGVVTRERLSHAPGRFQAAPSPRRYASADDVLRHRDFPGSILIDVRPPSLYAEGHIPSAVNVPWAQNLDEDQRFLTADKRIIMHCQVGLASSHSYVALRLLGFPSVKVYHRSWAEWGNDPSLPTA